MKNTELLRLLRDSLQHRTKSRAYAFDSTPYLAASLFHKKQSVSEEERSLHRPPNSDDDNSIGLVDYYEVHMYVCDDA